MQNIKWQDKISNETLYKNTKLLYPDYIAKLINNEVQPTTDELRKIAVERTEWSKFVVACKPRLFSAE